VDLTDYAFASAPIVIASVVKPSAGADNIFVAGVVVTTTTLTVHLSSPPTVTGYKMNWMVVR